MARENTKDFNKMMNDKKNLPKITKIEDEEGIKKWGGSSLVVAPPCDYDKYMKKVPFGKVITTSSIRKKIASDYKTEVCCPLTAGIFINICAWASFQRDSNITPYWRTLKAKGELNPKYPGGVLEQKKKLEDEGHVIITKGIKNIKYFVKDFEKNLIEI